MSIHWQPGSTINDLQELSKTHETISKAKTQTWHRILTHYLPLYFPEIAHFAGHSRSDWFLALIERFPTSGSITALGRDAFVTEAWPCGAKGLEGTADQRHLRDSLLVDRPACSATIWERGTLTLIAAPPCP